MTGDSGDNEGQMECGFRALFRDGTYRFPCTLKAEGSQVFVDFPALPVLPQQPPENPHPPQPHDLRRHTSLGRTLAFTVTGVTTETLGCEGIARAGAGVDDSRLDDAGRVGLYDGIGQRGRGWARSALSRSNAPHVHVPILEKLPHTTARVGLTNLSRLLGVKPNCDSEGDDAEGKSEGAAGEGS